MMDNPADKLCNVMWHFLQTGNQHACPDSMEEIAHDIIQCLTQKTAGQAPYKKPGDIYIGNFAMLVNMAAIEMVCTVLDPHWPQIRKILQEDEDEEYRSI